MLWDWDIGVAIRKHGAELRTTLKVEYGLYLVKGHMEVGFENDV